MFARELGGRTVAITGGARGIGLATAHACAHAGMTVVIGDLDPATVSAAAAGLGPRALGYPLDVTDRAAFARFLDDAERDTGRLDVLINNAGVLAGGRYADEDPASTERLVAVNVLAVMHGTRLALDRFLPRGDGHIVNMASSGGILALPNVATYTATKFAVLGFTRSVRQELRGTGVRITAVCPGHVDTEMTATFARLPGVRIQQPGDIAAAIVRSLRHRTAEVTVPREIRAAALLPALLPARAHDATIAAIGGRRLVSPTPPPVQ